MRFPSAAALGRRAWDVVLRFPWTIVAAAAAALAACIAADGSGTRSDDWARIAMTLMLAVPLTTAVTLAGERRGWPRMRVILGQAAGSPSSRSSSPHGRARATSGRCCAMSS